MIFVKKGLTKPGVYHPQCWLQTILLQQALMKTIYGDYVRNYGFVANNSKCRASPTVVESSVSMIAVLIFALVTGPLRLDPQTLCTSAPCLLQWGTLQILHLWHLLGIFFRAQVSGIHKPLLQVVMPFKKPIWLNTFHLHCFVGAWVGGTLFILHLGLGVCAVFRCPILAVDNLLLYDDDIPRQYFGLCGKALHPWTITKLLIWFQMGVARNCK